MLRPLLFGKCPHCYYQRLRITTITNTIVFSPTINVVTFASTNSDASTVASTKIFAISIADFYVNVYVYIPVVYCFDSRLVASLLTLPLLLIFSLADRV